MSRLMDEARRAAESAHCPYSHFRVGACVEAGGKLFGGCNVENASYGLTICAERVAIFRAVAEGHKRITAVAVSCIDAPQDGPAIHRMPCGACRQVMAEFADLSIPVHIDGVGEFTLAELLPNAFQLPAESGL